MRSLFKKYGNAGVFRHLLIKHAFVTGEVMVVWIVRQKKFAHREEMVQELVQRMPEIKSVVLNLNTREDNVILGKQEEVLYGESFITDEINGLKFHISAKSFYQVNPVQTKVLYGKALEFCNLKGNETVIDLYCGVGTISMFLAQKAGKVIGIEIVEQAVRDARENAALNGLDNVEFVCSDAAAYAKKMSEQGGRADVVVVDPPRKGVIRLPWIVSCRWHRSGWCMCRVIRQRWQEIYGFWRGKGIVLRWCSRWICSRGRIMWRR